MKVHIHWFRRDLRLEDNKGLYHALSTGVPVLPVFIFDDYILNKLPESDHRVNFIYDRLQRLHWQVEKEESSFLVMRGDVLDCWNKLLTNFDVQSVSFNRDYEPLARKRDASVVSLLKEKGVAFKSYKDHVIFERDEVVKSNKTPYSVFTPYKRRWLERFSFYPPELCDIKELKSNFANLSFDFPAKEQLGIEETEFPYPESNMKSISNYHKTRDYPSVEGTTKMGVHLRFGTISPRVLAYHAFKNNSTYLSELIWRDFFSQILYHFPHVVDHSFKKQYDNIEWDNDIEMFNCWKDGMTGYPLVDAGMRELNATGHMHNRVRMVTASFLCKHLLIDWRWGELYFAQKLFDYDLASNNGNWQWASGSGCDAAPYFRVFNPETQLRKFDGKMEYIKKWVPEYGTDQYPLPVVEHKWARDRAIRVYKQGLNPSTSLVSQ